jgi:hypothetical protein
VANALKLLDARHAVLHSVPPQALLLAVHMGIKIKPYTLPSISEKCNFYFLELFILISSVALPIRRALSEMPVSAMPGLAVGLLGFVPTTSVPWYRNGIP